jgi:hypothetical protein
MKKLLDKNCGKVLKNFSTARRLSLADWSSSQAYSDSSSV